MTEHLPRRPTCTVVPADRLRAAFEELRDAGAAAQTTFVLPERPWSLRDHPITCVAALTTHHDVRSALTALLRGAALVVSIDPAFPPSVERDLARLAAVRRIQHAEPTRIELSDDQSQILRLLAAGKSLPDVAAELFLSLRTAERRLSAARRLLGVRSTAEALVVMAGAGRTG